MDSHHQVVDGASYPAELLITGAKAHYVDLGRSSKVSSLKGGHEL